MKKLIILCLLIISGCTQTNKDVLFQTSTINALLEGIYDGQMSFNELKKKGDFGLGTFNALDGELIVLDGKFYQIKSDGKVYNVKGKMKTPFAAVTFFENDLTLNNQSAQTLSDLKNILDSNLKSKNLFYAIRIDAQFDYIKTRSVPKQTIPYPPLVQVAKNQPIFELKNTSGTLIGFKCPTFIKGINIPGYHFHYITDDRKAGGHVLELKMKNGTIQIDKTPEIDIKLLESTDFNQIDLSKNKQKELEKVEK